MAALSLRGADIDAYLASVLFLDDEREDGDTCRVTELAGELRALSLPPGSIIMIALPNGLRLLRCFFAVLEAGHVPLLAPPSMPSARVRNVAAKLGISAVIRPRITPGDFGEREHVRFAGLDLLTFSTHARRCHSPGQVALLTSGTSGFTSGCLHDFDALLRNAERHADSIGLRSEDRILVSLPIYYSFALVAQVLAAVRIGAELVVTGPPFTPARYNESISGYGITASSLTPLLVDTLLGSDGGLPKGLRVLTVGGQALAPERTTALLRRNPLLELYLTYGLTEAGPRVTTLAAHREPPHRLTSAGRPLNGVQLMVRDVGRGEREQELLVRSDTVYRERLGAASAPGRGGLVAPGTVATGDLGHLDDGYLFLRGRLSDFAIIRDEKVSLASVRQITESLAGVIRAVPSVQDGRSLDLDIYVHHEFPQSERAIRRRLAPLLTPSERPDRIRIHPVHSGAIHK